MRRIVAAFTAPSPGDGDTVVPHEESLCPDPHHPPNIDR